MYVNDRSEGLGVIPVAAAVAAASSLSKIAKGIFGSGKIRGWEGIDAHYNRAASNRFCFFLYYTGKTDRIEYYLKYLGEMGGGSGARTKEFIRRYTIFTNEVDQLASSLGFSDTKREEILWQPAWATMVSANGQWTPPTAAIPPTATTTSAAALTTSKTTEDQIEAASAFPVVPMLIAGAVLFFIGPKIFKSLKGR